MDPESGGKPDPSGGGPRARSPWAAVVARAFGAAAGAIRVRFERGRETYRALPETSKRRLRRLGIGGVVALALFLIALRLWIDVLLETTFLADTARAWRIAWNRFSTANVDFNSFGPVGRLVDREITEELDRRKIPRGGSEERDARWHIGQDLSATYLNAALEGDRLSMFKFAAVESRYDMANLAYAAWDSWVILKLYCGDSHPLTRYAEGMTILQMTAAARRNFDGWRHSRFLDERRRIPELVARLRAGAQGEPDAEARGRVCAALLSVSTPDLELSDFIRRFGSSGSDGLLVVPILEALAKHDTTAAVELIRGAAADGCLDAQFAMGDLYDEGLFLPHDPDEADRRYVMAGMYGYPAKRADRDPARTPVSRFRAPLEEDPFGVLRFSTDETEVRATASRRAARFSISNTASSSVVPLPPVVVLSEDGGRGLSSLDGAFAVIDARTGMVEGTIEIPACLKGRHLAGRFAPDGRTAWVMTGDSPNYSDQLGTYACALVGIIERRIVHTDGEFLRRTGVVSFEIARDLSRIAVNDGRRDPTFEFLPLTADAGHEEFLRLVPPEEMDEKYGGRERGFGFTEVRIHALQGSRYLSVFGVDMKGSFHCYDWFWIDPGRRLARPSKYVGARYISNDFEVIRSDGRWAFFEGYMEDYGGDGHLRDLESLRVTGAFPHRRLGVKTAAFSPSGRYLATTDGYLVKVWDLTRLGGYTLPARGR